jgi:hypothetical protein
MYGSYTYLSPKHQFPKGIWMIHVVEEIKLLLLLGNRFQPNLVHILLYVCVRILCMCYTYSAGRMVWEAGNLDDSHCKEIKLLPLLGNRLKHIRGNVRYLVTWNVKEFTVGYLLRLDK